MPPSVAPSGARSRRSERSHSRRAAANADAIAEDGEAGEGARRGAIARARRGTAPRAEENGVVS
jgi:hypothetical protein